MSWHARATELLVVVILLVCFGIGLLTRDHEPEYTVDTVTRSDVRDCEVIGE